MNIYYDYPSVPTVNLGDVEFQFGVPKEVPDWLAERLLDKKKYHFKIYEEKKEEKKPTKKLSIKEE